MDRRSPNNLPAFATVSVSDATVTVLNATQ